MNRPTRHFLLAAHAALLVTLSAAAQPVDQRDLDKLGSDDIELVTDARPDILDVIGNPGLSVGDRLQAAGQLVEPVRSLIASDDELREVNGLLLAGALVTPDAMELIETGFESDKPGVRYTATRALRNTFAILGSQRTPSLQAQEISRQIKTLGEVLRHDPDPYVSEGAARALVAAANMADPRLNPIAQRAFSELALGTADRMQSLGDLPEDQHLGIIRIAMVTNFNLRKILQDRKRNLDNKHVIGAASVAGDSLAYAYSRFQNAGRKLEAIDPSERDTLAQLVGTSELVVYFARARLERQPDRTSLREAFASGKDRDFNRGILALIGKSGVLCNPPFGLEADRFVPSGG
ncbi:MAG TPA: hypothetical protein ENJ00_00320 [Phycisphaerales bacterium]|nr:hypothetical protein [Phycisphaerales bacterium]